MELLYNNHFEIRVEGRKEEKRGKEMFVEVFNANSVLENMRTNWEKFYENVLAIWEKLRENLGEIGQKIEEKLKTKWSRFKSLQKLFDLLPKIL